MPTTVQTPKEATKQIESVDKALNILECFSDRSSELSLKQLSERTGLYKSRILRLCGTLESRGFLIRSQKSVYSLGPKLLMLGRVYERANSFISLSRPVLRELASLTGESTKLFVIEGHKRICLAREEGSYPLRYAVREGEEFDLYAGASGKVLLAYSPEGFRDSILKQTLKRITPATLVKRNRLEQEFEKIRKLGYATSKGEVVPEVAGIAAPVFYYNGGIAAALTVAGPIQHFAGDRFTEMCKLLLESARKLSHLMGYEG